jgi:hypothetical protein
MSKTQRFLLALLLIPALACGPIGCGAEVAVIPTILAVATTAGVVALTIHQFQQIESAELDNQMKRIRLNGMQNGVSSSVEYQLNAEQSAEINRSGQVRINGQVIPVSR